MNKDKAIICFGQGDLEDLIKTLAYIGSLESEDLILPDSPVFIDSSPDPEAEAIFEIKRLICDDYDYEVREELQSQNKEDWFIPRKIPLFRAAINIKQNLVIRSRLPPRIRSKD